MLEKLRSRGGRKQLEAASAAIVHPPELGTSGAQMGLQVMTALEAVVVEEGEVGERAQSSSWCCTVTFVVVSNGARH